MVRLTKYRQVLAMPKFPILTLVSPLDLDSEIALSQILILLRIKHYLLQIALFLTLVFIIMQEEQLRFMALQALIL